MRALQLAFVVLVALTGLVAAAPGATAFGDDCARGDVQCAVRDARCDAYEKLPPFIPWVCER